MKKHNLVFSFFCLAAILLCTPAFVYDSQANGSLQVIKLPDPKAQFAKYNDSMLLALENRQTTRSFSTAALDIHDISAMLWAACGVNRDSGKLTVPTSRNTQDMLMYVLNADGAWLYNAQENTLEQKSATDIRQNFTAAFVKTAPAIFLYVQDVQKASNERAGDKHAGSMYQNVGLYCAIAQLNNVVIGSYPQDIAKILNLPEHYRVVIAQSVGGKP